MHSRKVWLKWAVIAFSAAIVTKASIERHPDRLFMLGMIAAIGAAVVTTGWLFANRRSR